MMGRIDLFFELFEVKVKFKQECCSIQAMKIVL